MPVSGNAEPGEVSGPQQVQRQPSINFSTAIPIKKRRFPIIEPSSPSPDEQPSESKNKQESNTPDESGVSKISASVVKKEDASHSFASKNQEAKPSASLGSIDDLGSETDVLLNEKPSSESCVGAQRNVKQEIGGGGPSEKGLMSVELSLGPKEQLVPAFENNDDACLQSDKSDRSLLRLGLSEEKIVPTPNDSSSSAIGSVSRSNWDLNTTMDVWEGSANSDAFGRSSLTSTVGLSLSKRKNIPDDPRHAYMKPSKLCKTDNSLNLGLAMAYRELDASQKHDSLSDTRFSTSAKLNFGNRSVKPEPIDENSKRDCSIGIGSCGSSNTGLLKFSSVKRELVNNLRQETVLKSFVTPDCRSIKSEVVQEEEDNQEACRSEDALISQSARIMQHQESCASSSALPVPLVAQNLPSRLPICSELTISGGSHANQDEKQCKLARVDEDTSESCQYELAGNDEEKVNINDKEDEEYEDGEVREHVERSTGEEDRTVEKKNDSRHVQPFLLGDQSITTSDFDEDTLMKNPTIPDSNKDFVSVSYEPSNSLQKSSSDKMLEIEVDDENRSIVNQNELVDRSERKGIDENPGEEVSSERPTGDEATDKVVKETCFGENVSTLSNAEASFDGHDAAKEANNVSNKSRIINLSRSSDVTTPRKTTFIPNRLLASRSGKERFSDPNGEIQPRGSRNETYNGGSNKFGKGRIHDQSFRNSRPGYMRGKGRMSGRFGSSRNEWNSDHDFGSETSYGPSDYRVVRHKHASEMDIECNDYRIPQDGNALGNRRKTLNDEFPSLRRNSLRRDPPGDRDGPVTRGGQMLRRIPRNMSPSRCNIEASSDMTGLRHGDKFMRHISDDAIDPVFSRPQLLYDELDGQLVRGNRNFSNMQRKGYPRIRSKSPDRPRTRSPGLWSSPRRRSPNGLSELSQHRSPAMYRMGRMRSPDRACFRDEMVDRRRGSPSYVARQHPNDLRDVDSGREHVHPRSANSNRRSSPSRVFPRSGRRADALDSREMGDGEEYINGPLHSNKFHELRGDGSIDERRKFIERRGPVRSFRPNFSNDSDNFRFHLNDGPRQFRFCEEAEAEFVERSTMREREFEGHNEHMKHQSLVENRRIRNIEEQQDGNYRPVERIWHDDGFTDDRMKRRRF